MHNRLGLTRRKRISCEGQCAPPAVLTAGRFDSPRYLLETLLRSPVDLRGFQPPKPASLRDAGFAALCVAMLGCGCSLSVCGFVLCEDLIY